jgi:hypothetical protein
VEKHLTRATCCALLILLTVLVSYTSAQPNFSDWSAPVNLGAVINSTAEDASPALSRNRLSLYFHSARTGGLGLTDLWVSHRDSEEEPWGVPINLGEIINSTSDDLMPNLSRDGHRLFFVSRRTGSQPNPAGVVGFDIWVSYRDHVHDDFDWQPPVNLGPPVNSPAFDQSPFFLDNEEVGVPQLFFTRTVAPQNDLFVSNLLPDGTWSAPAPVSELNSASNERGISISFDGLEAFFMSNRPDGIGLQDLWTATRESVSDPWSAPTNMGALINGTVLDADPHISSDRETLFFASSRAGGYGGQDLYMTTRTKGKPRP